ncbi:MAG: hypothetical protein Q9194_004786, partial [Teloschistes cf. exilis]
TYDEKRGGDDPSQPLTKSTEKSSKAPKWVMQWMEEDELAKETRLRREARDRRFATTDWRNLYCYKNSDIKSALECMAGEALNRWKSEGKPRREIAGLIREERLREERKDPEGRIKKGR